MIANIADIDADSSCMRRHGYNLVEVVRTLWPEAAKSLAATSVDGVKEWQRRYRRLLETLDDDALVSYFDWPGEPEHLRDWLDGIDVDFGAWRCDMTYDGARWRILEVNAMNAGGWVAPRLYAQYRGNCGHAESWPDPASRLLRNLIDEYERRVVHADPSGERCLVLIAPESSEEFGDNFVAHCHQAVAGASPPWVICRADWSEIICDPNGASYSGSPAHILLELESSWSPKRIQAMSLHKKNHLLYCAGPVARFVNDKRLLASAVPHDAFAPAFCFKDGSASENLEQQQVIDSRNLLVAKQSSSDGGAGVFIGAHQSSQAWADIVKEAQSNGGWVFQEWVEPRLPPGEGPLTDDDTHLIWCPFVIGGVFSGGFVRVLDKAGYGTGAARNRPHSVADSANNDERIGVFPIRSTLDSREIDL